MDKRNAIPIVRSTSLGAGLDPEERIKDSMNDRQDRVRRRYEPGVRQACAQEAPINLNNVQDILSKGEKAAIADMMGMEGQAVPDDEEGLDELVERETQEATRPKKIQKVANNEDNISEQIDNEMVEIENKSNNKSGLSALSRKFLGI